MKRFAAVLFLLLSTACDRPRQKDWQTFFEKSGGLETPRYDETMRYLQRLDNASPALRVTSFGTSPLGRKNPLVIIDKDEKFSAPKVRKTGKAIVLIQAGIHAGEIDGKDAMLMLLRDMLIDGKYGDVLDRVTILFMPFFNVDGHERVSPYNRINQNGPKEMGWRVSAQNLNLNRDYIKADAPEMRDWLAVFNDWLPDLFIDCHVTDGADYRHVVTYAIDLSQNVAEPVRRWSADVYMPYLRSEMAKAGFPTSPYVFPVDDLDFTKGITAIPAPPRFSTEF
jgi:murein tripeptide amidase MpaA